VILAEIKERIARWGGERKVTSEGNDESPRPEEGACRGEEGEGILHSKKLVSETREMKEGKRCERRGT